MLDQAQYDHRDDFHNYLREGNYLAGAPHLIPLTLAPSAIGRLIDRTLLFFTGRSS